MRSDSDHVNRGETATFAGGGEDWPHSEIPVTADRLEYLITLRGKPADQAGQSPWCGDDIDRLRPHMLRVATQVLTEVQLRTWVAYVCDGQLQKDIATQQGIKKQSVADCLWGHNRAGERAEGRGGAMGRMAKALRQDAAFQAEVSAIEADRGPTQEADRSLYARWFTRHLLPGIGDRHFIPLTVLLVAHCLRDSKDEVPLNTLIAHLPRTVLNAGLGFLRANGFIVWEGSNIRIVKIPVEVQHG